MKKILKENKGYSILEIITAIGLFVVIVAININMFLSVIKVQRRAADFQVVFDSARYAMEIMTKEITSMDIKKTLDSSVCKNSSCLNYTNDYSVATTSLAIISGLENRKGKMVKFFKDNNDTLCMVVVDASQSNSSQANSCQDRIIGSFTNQKVKVSGFAILVNKLAPHTQPKVTIKLEVSSLRDSSVKIYLQTTISPVMLNI